MLASTPPDFGSPSLSADLAVWGSCLLTALALRSRVKRDNVHWAAFMGAFLGAAIGLLVYAFGLLTGLY